jgi:hypothetical protein
VPIDNITLIAAQCLAPFATGDTPETRFEMICANLEAGKWIATDESRLFNAALMALVLSYEETDPVYRHLEGAVEKFAAMTRFVAAAGGRAHVDDLQAALESDDNGLAGKIVHAWRNRPNRRPVSGL